MQVHATFELSHAQTVFCYVNGHLCGTKEVDATQCSVTFPIEGFWERNMISFVFPMNKRQSVIQIKDVGIDNLYYSILPKVFHDNIYVSNLDQSSEHVFTELYHAHQFEGPGVVGVRYEWPLEEWYFRQQTTDAPAEDKQRLALSRFINYGWADTKKRLKSGPMHELPILPLDAKLEAVDCDSIAGIFDIDTSNEPQMKTVIQDGQTKLVPDLALKENKRLTLFGPDSTHYPKVHEATATSHTWQECEQKLQGIDFYWHHRVPALEQLVEALGIKTLYTIEFRTILPMSIQPVHGDHETKSLFNGLKNRLYIPISWNEHSNLAFYGVGNVKIDLGRVYCFNGNAYKHGARNNHPTKIRHALLITANVNSERFDKLLQESYKKFLSWL